MNLGSCQGRAGARLWRQIAGVARLCQRGCGAAAGAPILPTQDWGGSGFVKVPPGKGGVGVGCSPYHGHARLRRTHPRPLPFREGRSCPRFACTIGFRRSDSMRVASATLFRIVRPDDPRPLGGVADTSFLCAARPSTSLASGFPTGSEQQSGRGPQPNRNATSFMKRASSRAASRDASAATAPSMSASGSSSALA